MVDHWVNVAWKLRRCIAAKLPLIAAGCRSSGKIMAEVFGGVIRSVVWGMYWVSACVGYEMLVFVGFGGFGGRGI